MHKALLIIALILALLSGLAAISPDPRAKANERAQHDAVVFAKKSASFEQINWMLVKDSALEQVAIWDRDGVLLYPPKSGMVPLRFDLSKDTVLELADRQRHGNPSDWTSFRGSPDHVLNCRSAPAVCLIYDREAFETSLNLKPWGWSVSPKVVSVTLAFFALLSLIAAKLVHRPLGEGRDRDECFQLFPDRFVAVYGENEVALTKRELKLLTTLQMRHGDVVTKDELYDAAWGRTFMPNSRALDQHVITLRRKLDPNKSLPALIETVRGIGYRMVQS